MGRQLPTSLGFLDLVEQHYSEICKLCSYSKVGQETTTKTVNTHVAPIMSIAVVFVSFICVVQTCISRWLLLS